MHESHIGISHQICLLHMRKNIYLVVLSNLEMYTFYNVFNKMWNLWPIQAINYYSLCQKLFDKLVQTALLKNFSNWLSKLYAIFTSPNQFLLDGLRASGFDTWWNVSSKNMKNKNWQNSMSLWVLTIWQLDFELHHSCLPIILKAFSQHERYQCEIHASHITWLFDTTMWKTLRHNTFQKQTVFYPKCGTCDQFKL
jgi:hypothetical protein